MIMFILSFIFALSQQQQQEVFIDGIGSAGKAIVLASKEFFDNLNKRGS